MKKKNLISLICVLVVLSMTISCKKGEDDPFFSLLSRTARITGTWELTKEERITITTFPRAGVIVSDTVSRYFSDTLLTIRESGYNYSYGYSQILVIEKNGVLSETLIQNSISNTRNGDWWWLDDQKNKSRIALFSELNSYHILELKNKHLVLTADYYENVSYTDGRIYKQIMSTKLEYEKK